MDTTDKVMVHKNVLKAIPFSLKISLLLNGKTVINIG